MPFVLRSTKISPHNSSWSFTRQEEKEMKVESSLRAVIEHLLTRAWVKSRRRGYNTQHLFGFTAWFLKEAADFLCVCWFGVDPSSIHVPFPLPTTHVLQASSHKFLATVSFPSPQARGIFSHFGLDWI